jgi:hypothetical protein
MKLEDTSARLRNASVADAGQMSPLPSLFQAIEHRIPRTAEEETDVALRLRSLFIASESWLVIL